MDRLRISNEIQAMTMSFQTGIKFHYKYRYTCVSLSYPKTEQGIVMQDISAEEREKRIAATNANPWVQLAREGVQVWNGFMLKHFGREQFPQNILSKTNEMQQHIYDNWIKKLNIENKIDFKENYFDCVTNFNDFIFPDTAIFSNTIFEESAFFIGAHFLFYVDFSGSKFCEHADFSDAQIKLGKFEGAKFQSTVIFLGSKFNHCNFSKSIFSGTTNFNNVEIRVGVFKSTIFKKNCTFIASEILQIDFIGSNFFIAPRFEGAKCEVIYLNKESFNATKPYVDKESLEVAASAWAALIRLMEKVHNLPMRHEFHNKLLKVEAQYKTEKYAKPLYAIHSWMGAGQSAFLPLYGWISFNVLFFAYYSYFVPVVSKALPFTLMNAIPFITTFNKKIVDDFIECKEDVISYIMFGAGIHTFLSGVFIFFIGLALRNRFRVK